MQGKIAKENQVRALHVYVDEMHVVEAKPRLMAIYKEMQASLTGSCSTSTCN